MPFRHPDRSADLGARIEFEVRERVEEAVDYVCLEALVRSRRARGLPLPTADSAADKAAYAANVLEFLDRLRREVIADLGTEVQSKLVGLAGGSGDEQALMTTQVVLARMLPDYWQRFDAARARYLAGAPFGDTDPENATRPPDPAPGAHPESGSEGRGLLARLFGRG